ncbi:hypothetical protein STENM327S_01712 [Streptomyces tendae]
MISSRACEAPEPYRCWKITDAYAPDASSAAAMSSYSARESHSGFSHSTHAPASSAATVCSRCSDGGVPTRTRSGRTASSMAPVDAYPATSPGTRAQKAASRAGSTSTAATSSVRSAWAARAGR